MELYEYESPNDDHIYDQPRCGGSEIRTEANIGEIGGMVQNTDVENTGDAFSSSFIPDSRVGTAKNRTSRYVYCYNGRFKAVLLVVVIIALIISQAVLFTQMMLLQDRVDYLSGLTSDGDTGAMKSDDAAAVKSINNLTDTVSSMEENLQVQEERTASVERNQETLLTHISALSQNLSALSNKVQSQPGDIMLEVQGQMQMFSANFTSLGALANVVKTNLTRNINELQEKFHNRTRTLISDIETTTRTLNHTFFEQTAKGLDNTALTNQTLQAHSLSLLLLNQSISACLALYDQVSDNMTHAKQTTVNKMAEIEDAHQNLSILCRNKMHLQQIDIARVNESLLEGIQNLTDFQDEIKMFNQVTEGKFSMSDDNISRTIEMITDITNRSAGLLHLVETNMINNITQLKNRTYTKMRKLTNNLTVLSNNTQKQLIELAAALNDSLQALNEDIESRQEIFEANLTTYHNVTHLRIVALENNQSEQSNMNHILNRTMFEEVYRSVSTVEIAIENLTRLQQRDFATVNLTLSERLRDQNSLLHALLNISDQVKELNQSTNAIGNEVINLHFTVLQRLENQTQKVNRSMLEELDTIRLSHSEFMRIINTKLLTVYANLTEGMQHQIVTLNNSVDAKHWEIVEEICALRNMTHNISLAHNEKANASFLNLSTQIDTKDSIIEHAFHNWSATLNSTLTTQMDNVFAEIDELREMMAAANSTLFEPGQLSSPYADNLDLFNNYLNQSLLEGEECSYAAPCLINRTEPISNCDEGYIQTDNYPTGNYRNNINQSWVVEVPSPSLATLQLTLFLFDLEVASDCRYDFLEVQGQKYCGSLSNQTELAFNVAGTSSVTMIFRTDGSVVASGFLFKFEFL